MIFSLIKIILSLFISISIFIFWNINYNQTFLKPPKTGKTSTVYILNYSGKHNSLLLEGLNGWKEFSYGDWDVYGRSHVTFWTGFKSMGLPTQGALGHRLVNWDGKDWKQLPQLLEAKNILPILVSSKEANKLYHDLENFITSSHNEFVFNPQNKLYFVKYPKAYAAWHTCNNILISWLKEMNVKVEGWGWAGNFLIIS